MDRTSAVTPVPIDNFTPTNVIDLRSRLHACPLHERDDWMALQSSLADTLHLHSHELHIETGASGIKLRHRTIDNFVEIRPTHAAPIHNALVLLESQLWPERKAALCQRAWFFLAIDKKDYLFQIDKVKTSDGSSYCIKRLYNTQNPLPQLDQIITQPNVVARLRERLTQSRGLILLGDSDRVCRVRTARALAQCITSPNHRILISETACHPLVPGTSQIRMPPELRYEHRQAWLHACDMSQDVIFALELDHEPEKLIKLAAADTLVVQGVCASSASQALSQLMSSGARHEAIATTLTSIFIQHRIGLACPQCKCTSTPDEFLNEKISLFSPVRTGAIQDWLADRLTDRFVEAEGCRSCHQSGIGEIVTFLDCIDLSREVRDALSDGDITYAQEQMGSLDKLPQQLIKMAQAGSISLSHAFERLSWFERTHPKPNHGLITLRN